MSPASGPGSYALRSGRYHSPDGDMLRGFISLIVPQCGFQGCQRHFVDTHGTHQGVFGDAFQYLSLSYQDARLRAAQ